MDTIVGISKMQNTLYDYVHEIKEMKMRYSILQEEIVMDNHGNYCIQCNYQHD